jgi:hypothetical protein
MKKLVNLKGVKTLSIKQQQLVFGGEAFLMMVEAPVK